MSEERIIRELLVEIERDPGVSQRRLSEVLSVSVGTINWHLKRCVKKGLVKLSQVPVKRYLYYLTPEGFTEKSRLTADYLSTSFDIFRVGRQQYEALFNLCLANDWKNIILVGDSELAELAMLVLSRIDNVNAHCVFDAASKNKTCAGLPVKSTVEDVLACVPGGRVDAIVGTGPDIKLPEKCDLEMLLTKLNLNHSQSLIPAFI